MKVAAVTITYNRLNLTKQTVESFYAKTGVDFHLFIDNGSTDGTQEYLKKFPHILMGENYGIAYAFREAVRHLSDYDYILKLDNDVLTETPDIINRMLQFYKLTGNKYVCSPVDLNIDPAFYPKVISSGNYNGYNIELTTHTGGAFQMIPIAICERLCMEFRHLKHGDFMIGKYYRKHGYKPVYLKDLQMRHIGIFQSCPDYVL